MTPNDHRRFLALLTGVHSFYRQDLTDFAEGVWRRAMEPYAIEAIERAFDAHSQDPKAGSFMPKPADLIRLLDGSHEDRAAVAWSKVHQAMARVGAYATVAFDDPAIHSAVTDLGGWPAMCAGTIDELPFLQRRFAQAYSAHSRAGSAHPPMLPGLHDGANVAKGHAMQKPVLIGDPVKAQRVIATGQTGERLMIAGTFVRAGVPRLCQSEQSAQ
jgi:hypothetical protein